MAPGKKKGQKSARPIQAQKLRDGRLNVRMPADLLEKITQIAVKEGRTASAQIVFVMSNYVLSQKSK